MQEKTSELSSKASKAAHEAEQKLSDAANKVQDMSDKALGQAKVRQSSLIFRRVSVSVTCHIRPAKHLGRETPRGMQKTMPASLSAVLTA